MYVTTNSARSTLSTRDHQIQWVKAFSWSVLLVAVFFFLLPGLAHAGGSGTGTGTGAGGAATAQARITAVATGWQNIVQGVGIAVLVIAWSYVGYMVAFGGKTMKDMTPAMLGTSVAGLAPVLVGWMFS